MDFGIFPTWLYLVYLPLGFIWFSTTTTVVVKHGVTPKWLALVNLEIRTKPAVA